MRIEPNSPQQEMDAAKINYYRCVAGSHTLFWLCATITLHRYWQNDNI